MRKGEITKLDIVQRAAPIFNRRGYSGTSIADIMQATGLKKGGIYNHFKSKEHLALESFGYSVREVRQYYAAALKGQESSKDQLFAFIDSFTDFFENPPVVGGCPILNTAIECDDELPTIRVQARRAMKNWHAWLARIIKSGMKNQEFKTNIDPKAAATLFIACSEGGLMLSKLHDSPIYIQQSSAHLRQYVENELSS